MKQMQMEAKLRTATRKNAVGRLRVQNVVPAVMYGHGEKAENLELSGKTIQQVLNTPSLLNMLIQLSILTDAAPRQEIVMIKETQRHPVTSKVMHVDFQRIAMDQELEAHVPVILTGTAPGVKGGGVWELVQRELLVRCLPALIPESISLDISALNIGDAITVKDLQLPEGVTSLVDIHEPVVHVVAAKVEEVKPAEAAAPAAAGAPAAAKEPEVIGEKEREERRTSKTTGKE